MNDTRIQISGDTAGIKPPEPVKPRVLVVDDEERNRRLLVAMLEAEGYTGLEAADGAQALELARQNPPDIVLLDIMMPGMDGYDVARALKAGAATQGIPIVMVTALDDRASRLRGLEAGAEEFVTKPVDRNELRIRVRNLLRLKEFSDYLANHSRILEEQVRERTAKVTRLNRVYAVLSGINTLIVRVHDRQELFNEACRIAVKHGKFAMAWIGMLDHGTLDVTPVAWAGDDAEPFARMRATARGDVPEGQGVMGRAIREKQPVFENDIVAEQRSGGPRRQEALRRGYRSLIALPLLVGGEAAGNLSLYAREPDFFNADELKVLVELAGDISFAMEYIGVQRELEDERQLLHNLMDSVPEAIFFKDREHRYVRLNRVQVKRLGVSNPEQAIGKTSEDLRPQEFALKRDAEEKEIFASGIALADRVARVEEPDGQVCWFSTTKAPIKDKEGKVTGLVGISRDVTEQQLADEKIRRLNRVYAMLSGINTLIVHARERQELFHESCRIAVEDGQFPFAWIGVLDPATQDVTPVAWAGEHAAELTRGKSSARDDIQEGKGAVGQAIRKRRPVLNNDITIHSSGGPRLKEVLRLGFRSQITLPLFENQTVTGTLTMYAKEPNFFDEEELGLLEGLAGDISFALENISRQRKLDKLSRIRAVSSGINAAIIRIHEREALLRETCRVAVEDGKFTLVWIAMLDQEKQEIRPVAWEGFSPEAVHAVSWTSISAPGAMLAEAIQTRQVAVRNDIDTELPAGKLRQEAMNQGCRSSVCVPFMVDDKVMAAIMLFAAGRGFFDEEELALLSEVAADVSLALQAIAKQEKLEYLSYYDVLTGLPNRALFVDRLSQQMRSRSGEPQMVALIVIDLERFRNINESLGHRGGDELLRTISHRLGEAFHGKDYLARISSNGFGVIVRGLKDAADIVHVLDNDIFACFRQPFTVSDRELRVSVKAGIAMYPADGENAEFLFRNAESALKRAKASGDRYLFYAADMNAQAAHAMALETRLRTAVEAQQFVLHYQTKIELATGRICGLEALIRWNDPESGLVPPGRFIPLLEETGLILEVGRWALAQALADYRDWTARGCTVPRVAVNVSAVQLQQKNFTDIVARVVEQAGGLSQALELEVTESLIMKDIDASIGKLAVLRESGVHIAMDDFGTGYSSLSYLARLPINTVKIDRSFINGMAAGADAMAIVSTIIALTHSLSLRVVAEGVETAEQARFLRLLRCDEAQGYLFSRPVPKDDVLALLRTDSTVPG